MFASDAATYLADFGDPLSWTPSIGGAPVTGPALFDQGDAGADGGNHISREYSITVETAAWPGLKRSEIVVLGGAGGSFSYRLRTDLIQQEDAVFSTVKLTKV